MDEFSVYQWFVDGTREDVIRFVGAEQAVKCAEALAASIGGQLGTTRRVIITDGGDFCVWEWKFNEGVVFPPGARQIPKPAKPPEITIVETHKAHQDSYWQAGFDAAKAGKDLDAPFDRTTDPEDDEDEAERRLGKINTMKIQGWENGYRWYWANVKENA